MFVFPRALLFRGRVFTPLVGHEINLLDHDLHLREGRRN